MRGRVPQGALSGQGAGEGGGHLKHYRGRKREEEGGRGKRKMGKGGGKEVTQCKLDADANSRIWGRGKGTSPELVRGPWAQGLPW